MRRRVKSPPVKLPNNPGIGVLADGQRYVSGWPSERKLPNLANVAGQSLVEAAGWCKKARVMGACSRCDYSDYR